MNIHGICMGNFPPHLICSTLRKVDNVLNINGHKVIQMRPRTSNY